jgi:hypothetical protein
VVFGINWVAPTCLHDETPATPLQLKLNALAEVIAKLGSLVGLLLFIALMICFFIQLKTEPPCTANQKVMSFVQILIISVTPITVTVPEGASGRNEGIFCVSTQHVAFWITTRYHLRLGICYEPHDVPCSGPGLM